MELGFGEIIVIMAIVLLLFGPKKLPQLGEALGRGIRNFKDAASGKEEREAVAPPAQPARPGASSASGQADVVRDPPHRDASGGSDLTSAR